MNSYLHSNNVNTHLARNRTYTPLDKRNWKLWICSIYPRSAPRQLNMNSLLRFAFTYGGEKNASANRTRILQSTSEMKVVVPSDRANNVCEECEKPNIACANCRHSGYVSSAHSIEGGLKAGSMPRAIACPTLPHSSTPDRTFVDDVPNLTQSLPTKVGIGIPLTTAETDTKRIAPYGSDRSSVTCFSRPVHSPPPRPLSRSGAIKHKQSQSNHTLAPKSSRKSFENTQDLDILTLPPPWIPEGNTMDISFTHQSRGPANGLGNLLRTSHFIEHL